MDFVETVQKKVHKAQELINEIETSRKCLQNNCETMCPGSIQQGLHAVEDLKDDIDTACNQQIAAVCQRKDQLCHQVELLAAEQEGQLQSDLAKLHQYQGSLLSVLQLYAAGTLKNDSNAFTCLQDLELPNVTTAVPQLHFAKTGEKELEKAVRGFGCAKLHHVNAPVGNFKDSQTSLFSGECAKVSDSNEPWLLCDMDNCSGEDEVVAASLPKSLSATSSSIEAVSMDEDDTPGTFHKLVEDHPKCNRVVQDQSSWLLPNNEYIGKNELFKLTRTFSEMKTSDIRNEEINWLLLPKDFVTCKSDLVMSNTSDVNSEWLCASKVSPMLTSWSYTTKIRDMFKPYFDHRNNSIWIASAP
ncbi:uncharacterized protein LOC142582395 isoform X1 [Dermacentor variabilis]|uniref:uncharacterized protein LOC142582395 isoform X1 n=1 Tax=Dermacentor variabilis TaxID=34621 RepID=UPI003F5B011A